MSLSGQGNRARTSSKLNARPASSLQVLSPRARAANATGSPLQQPVQSNARDKGKGRARPVDIIELSDSDSDDAPAPSTSRFAPVPQQEALSINEPPAQPPRTLVRDAGPMVAPALEENNVPMSGPSVLPVVNEARVEPAAQQEPPIAGTSNANSLDHLIASILEIVPDVDPDHIMSLFMANNPDGTMERATALVEPILHNLFENDNYPKKKAEVKRKRQEDAEVPVAGPSKPKKRRIETQAVVKMDVASKDRPRIYSPNYDYLCMYWLGVKFPYLRKPFLTKIFAQNNNLYAPTFVQITNLEAARTITATQRKRTPTRPSANGPLRENEEFDREFQWCADWQPGKSGEIEYIVKPVSDEAGPSTLNEQSSTKDVRPEEEEIESEECEAGEGMECGTCCSEYVVTTMIQCPDGHLFCKSCVFRLSKERLGQRSTKIKCMESQTDCQLEFMVGQLELCLPPQLLALYHRVKQAEEISAAGLENLEECPFCEYKCVIDNDNERLFRCENEECGVISCRGCKKKDHLPKTCAEMEEDNTLNAQHAIEEAMTNALMRKCPKCQATFVKTDGCNKITCAKCGQLSCYICRQAIKGYEHFNQAPGGQVRAGASTSQNKCALWDGPNGVGGAGMGLAQRHHEEVTKAREEALAKLKQSNPEVDVSMVKVDAPEVPQTLIQQQQLYPLPPMAYPPMPAMPRMPVRAIPGYPDVAQIQQDYYDRLVRGGVPQPPPVPRAQCNCPNCRRRR